MPMPSGHPRNCRVCRRPGLKLLISKTSATKGVKPQTHNCPPVFLIALSSIMSTRSPLLLTYSTPDKSSATRTALPPDNRPAKACSTLPAASSSSRPSSSTTATPSCSLWRISMLRFTLPRCAPVLRARTPSRTHHTQLRGASANRRQGSAAAGFSPRASNGDTTHIFPGENASNPRGIRPVKPLLVFRPYPQKYG